VEITFSFIDDIKISLSMPVSCEKAHIVDTLTDM